jgi:hypothetical protein
MDNEINIARIRLKSSAALFAEPEADPFDPDSRYISGIDEIANQLRWAPRGNPYRIILALPEAELTDEMQVKTREALQRYCANQVQSNLYERQSMRMEARLDFSISLLYALSFLTIGGLISLSGIFPSPVIFMIGSLLGIFTWAALWPAADLFLFSWRPYMRAAKLYQKLQQAELIFEAI